MIATKRLWERGGRIYAFRLPPELVRQLDKAAKDTFTSRSFHVRAALAVYFEKVDASTVGLPTQTFADYEPGR